MLRQLPWALGWLAASEAAAAVMLARVQRCEMHPSSDSGYI